MFSKACEYAIRATVYIARKSREGVRPSLAGIAYEIGSPTAFTSKILQQLVKSGLIFSTRGQTGGFGIDEKIMQEKTISDIVSAIDGDDIYVRCGLGLKECSGSQPCPVHEKFVEIRSNLRNVLGSTTIDDMTTKLIEGITYLKR